MISERTTEELLNELDKLERQIQEREINKSVLTQAGRIINGERQDTYGCPEDSFEIIADFWSSYLKHRGVMQKLQAKDVGKMMMLLKIARMIGQAESRDNYIDLCGYAAIVADRMI